MQNHECPCAHVYDPEIGDPNNNIPAGTPFEDLPDDWVCPKCDSEKDFFEPID
jgi:rubredoxin